MQGHLRARERTIFWLPDGWTKQDMAQKITTTNPLSWNLNSEWVNALDKNLAITTKAKNYNFANRLAKEYSGSVKSIIPTTLQDFDCQINHASGLLETRGELVDKIRKLVDSGDLHNFDISLFWGSLRQNVKDRINAFI
jgi:hypothetical protein